MSDQVKIQEVLNKAFHQEGHRIVFWNDPEKEFQFLIASLELDGVTKIHLDQESNLRVKLRLEKEEPNTKFLLYSAKEEPDYEADWLLDIRLYSRTFRADRASILLQDLGLSQQNLKSHLSIRRKFFDSKDRVNKLKLLVQPNDSAADLDRKMMAVIAKVEQPDLFNLVSAFFHGWLDVNELDLTVAPSSFAQIEKLELDDSFWEMVKAAFGHTKEDPTLGDFLKRLLITDLAHHAKGKFALGLQYLVLPENGWHNAVVCLGSWRDSLTRGESYDKLSTEVAEKVGLKNFLSGYEAENLAEVPTFIEVEKRITTQLRERIEHSNESIEIDSIRSIINLRQASYWANTAKQDNRFAPRKALHALYDALLTGAEFILLWQQNRGRLDFKNPKELYKAYESELYKFDQLYRQFSEAANIAESQGWDNAKLLRPTIEAHYVNGFLNEFSLAWGKFLEPADGLLSKWRLEQIPNQYEFYKRNVEPWISGGEKQRAFVIISDAFRYEAAQELVNTINSKYRMEATLSSQLGVLPSYTGLGMASLLPHQKLKYSGMDVLVDGMSSSASNRGNILASVNGIACKASELMAMKKDEGREFTKDKKVIYIYQDIVDATGDDAKTEGATFEGVRRAIDDLTNLISNLMNNFNASYIVVTADHGFLYSDTNPGNTNKSNVSKPDDAIVTKKRYILANNIAAQDSAWKGKVRTSAGVDDETEFLIPKGTSLFNFVGGARFIHGGAMPQEICVPVITIKQVRKQDTKPKPVTVHVLGTQHRVTTGVCRFQMLQMEAVSDRLTAITLKIAIFENDIPVSNIVSINFDSDSPSLDDRKKWITLTLAGQSFDKKKSYKLILTDAATGSPEVSVDVIIDRMVTDDF